MRTTKVKRLWPVMALAPLLALAAILAVSLWHSGPGGLTLPAAEAQGVDLDLGALTPTPSGGNTCQVADDDGGLYHCISNEDTLTVTFPITGAEAGVVYVSGASGESENFAGPHKVYPRFSLTDAMTTADEDDDTALGARGTGVFAVAGTGGFGNAVMVKRSWADNDGVVWMWLDHDDSNPVLEVGVTPSYDTADDAMVKVFFTQAIDLDTSTITGLPTDPLPAKEEASSPTSRAMAINGNDVTFRVAAKGSAIDGQENWLGGRIEVRHEFAAASNLKDEVDLTDTMTQPEPDDPVAPPGLAMVTVPASDDITLDGWETTGPVSLTVDVTHISATGERTDFDSFTLYRAGPAARIMWAGTLQTPDEPHYTTSGTEYTGFGTLKILDAVDRDVTTSPEVFVEGADAAATAILTDNEAQQTLTATEWGAAGGFSIHIKNTATTGEYDLNLVVKAPEDEDGMRDTLAQLPIKVEVVGAADGLSGDVQNAGDLVNPGQMLMLENVALTSMGQQAYKTPCSLTDAGTGATDVTIDSICEWAEPDGQSVLERRSGLVEIGGTQSIMVKTSAAPGAYKIVLSDGRDLSLADLAPDRELDFTVRGRPAMYTLTGPVVDGTVVTRIPRGKIASFTVTATDANGNLPYFPERETAEDVSIVISGDSASVTPLRLTDGKVTLNDRGEASFQIRVNNDAPSGSISIDAVGLGTGLASQTVAIGPVSQPRVTDPSGMSATAMVDGSTASVTLSWTPGANATRHFLFGMKQADLTAGDFSAVIWQWADSNNGHTVPNLEVGQEYVFSVIAYNRDTGFGSWLLPVYRYTPRAPTTGGGTAPPCLEGITCPN